MRPRFTISHTCRVGVGDLGLDLYLGKTNPALVTCFNSDTCEALHFTLSFNEERAQREIDRAQPDDHRRDPDRRAVASLHN